MSLVVRVEPLYGLLRRKANNLTEQSKSIVQYLLAEVWQSEKNPTVGISFRGSVAKLVFFSRLFDSQSWARDKTATTT